MHTEQMMELGNASLLYDKNGNIISMDKTRCKGVPKN